jgi:branched-subunit amino acid transport protein
MEPDPRQTQGPVPPRPLSEIGRADARRGAGSYPFPAPLPGRPEEVTAPTLWRTTAQWIVAALVTVLLMYLTYTDHGWVWLLSYFDLGVHEFGHLLTFWAPALLCSFAGSFMQVAAPLGLGGYFWWRRDSFAAILMIAWAAESLNNVSVYVGDAQAMVLPLFNDDGSGAGHDWHNILSAAGLLASTDTIASIVRTASVILFVIALGLAVLGFARARRA